MTLIPFWGARYPQLYDILQRSTDPEGRIVSAVEQLLGWENQTVADVGCGRGDLSFRMAEKAQWVHAVDPDPLMYEQWLSCKDSQNRPSNVSWHMASVVDLPLAKGTVDGMYAFWSYFFGQGAEPGLREARRVIRPGGHLVVVQNHGFDEISSLWPEWEFACLRWANWFAQHGFSRKIVSTRWCFPSEDEAVVLLSQVWGPESLQKFFSMGTLEYEYKAAIYYQRYYEV